MRNKTDIYKRRIRKINRWLYKNRKAVRVAKASIVIGVFMILKYNLCFDVDVLFLALAFWYITEIKSR